MSDKVGFAQCLNQACDQIGVCHEVLFVETTTEIRSPDMPSLVISESVHRHLADDQDIQCPACGLPRALMPELPREIPKMLA